MHALHADSILCSLGKALGAGVADGWQLTGSNLWIMIVKQECTWSGRNRLHMIVVHPSAVTASVNNRNLNGCWHGLLASSAAIAAPEGLC